MNSWKLSNSPRNEKWIKTENKKEVDRTELNENTTYPNL